MFDKNEKEKFQEFIRTSVNSGAVKVQAGITRLIIFKNQAHFDEWFEKKVSQSEPTRIVGLETKYMLLSGFKIPDNKDINEIGFVGVAFSELENCTDAILKATIMYE